MQSANSYTLDSALMSDAFRRLSVAFKLGKNKVLKPMDSSTTLADFLVASKQEYLKAIQETPSRGEEWTVVMGNEACGKYLNSFLAN